MRKIYKISAMLGLGLALLSNMANAQYPFWRWIAGPKTTNNSGVYPTAVGLSDNNAYPSNRMAGAAQFKDGKLYIFGGHNGSTANRLADMWSYDINTQAWTLLNAESNTYSDGTAPYGVSKTPNSSTRPGGRSGINSALVGDDIYIFGGQGYGTSGTGGGKLNDFWKYNITNNTWTLLRGALANNAANAVGTKGGIDDGSFNPRSRSNGNLTAVGTDVYLYGGEGSGVTGDLWKWDTTTSKWLWLTGNNGSTAAVNNGTDDAANTPSARQGAAFVAIGTKIYLFGGTTLNNNEGNMQNDLWVYDTSSGFWNLIAPEVGNTPPAIRKDTQGWTANGKLYIFGGVSRADGSTSKVTNDLWEYNLATNIWTKLKGDDAPTGTYSLEDYNSAEAAPAASATTTPSGRVGILAAANGKKLYLFGGDRATNWNTRYGDLWLMDLDETVLPVNFISFAAKATTAGVQLNWQVASETDHKQYIVSRSTNGTDYTVVATTTAHSATDNNVAPGTYYYKLEQQDNDGKINYLSTQVVKVGLSANGVVAYPNPTQGNVSVAVTAGAYSKYSVVSLQGTTVVSGAISSAATQLNVNLTGLAAGTYIVQLTGTSGNAVTRVIKL